MRIVRAPTFDNGGLRRGSWTQDEDNKLVAYIMKFGHGNWRALPKQAGLQRCGKSCRLRWINYLRPDIKRGNFTKEEEDTIINLHGSLGNKWSKIASHLPGRTDNEIKNIWNTYLKKRITASSCSSDDSSKMMTTQVMKNCDNLNSEIQIVDDHLEEVWGNSTAEISSSSDHTTTTTTTRISKISSSSDHTTTTTTTRISKISSSSDHTTTTTTTRISRSFCEELSFGFDDMWIEKLEKELDLWGSTSELLNDSDELQQTVLDFDIDPLFDDSFFQISSQDFWF